MRILATLVIVGICANSSLADEVFTWTDDEGVVHFSQWAPAHTSGVTTLNTVSSNAADYLITIPGRIHIQYRTRPRV